MREITAFLFATEKDPVESKSADGASEGERVPGRWLLSRQEEMGPGTAVEF